MFDVYFTHFTFREHCGHKADKYFQYFQATQNNDFIDNLISTKIR